MKIGIIGLGLIGGSLASAFSEAGHHVLGFDKDKSVRDFAKMVLQECRWKVNFTVCIGMNKL